MRYLVAYSAACSVLAASLALGPGNAFAESSTDAQYKNLLDFQQQLKQQQEKLEKTQRQLDAQIKEIEEQRAALKKQQQQINALTQAVVAPPTKPVRASTNNSTGHVTTVVDTKTAQAGPGTTSGQDRKSVV